MKDFVATFHFISLIFRKSNLNSLLWLKIMGVEFQISGSHIGDDKDSSLLWYDAMSILT
jgi:hypothetical protein